MLPIEVDGHGVAPADHHTGPLADLRAVLSAQQRGERRCPAGLRHNPEHITQGHLCSVNLDVRDQHHLLQSLAYYEISQLTHPPRPERIGGKTTEPRFSRPPRPTGPGQRGTPSRPYGKESHVPAIPGRSAP